MPISYDKFFLLLKQKGLKKYDLRKNKVIGVATLDNMRTGKRHAVVQALAVDPITCANGLSIGEIRKLEQQMYDANAPFLEYLK